MAAVALPADDPPPSLLAAAQDLDPPSHAPGSPSVALADLLSQRIDLVPPPAQVHDARSTALVPSCELGHDVLLLSSFGYDVVGLDSSPERIRLAREHAAKTPQAPAAGCQKGSITWVVGDFFASDWAQHLGTQGSGQFDLIFDYKFLCTLPPESRPQWAKRISQLVRRPDGRLICLEYPSGKPLSEGGPPWGVTPEVYEALLTTPAEPVSYDDDGNVVENKPAKPDPNALLRLSIIKPARTHDVGTNGDGSVVDFISVWAPS